MHLRNTLKTEIESYLKKLFPITRSITGIGNRKTLKILTKIIPLKILDYPSGKKCFDWTIPLEWNINDAWIKNSKGQKIINFRNNNLHVVNYSIPVHKKLKLRELKKHLFYVKNLPTAIPYRTSYYNSLWGFCVSYNDYIKFINDQDIYEVFIDSKLENGSLFIGELFIKGTNKKEFLISTYFCHPSLANDNLSGVVLTAFLARWMLKRKMKYSYRIIFIPETIGAVVYGSSHEKRLKEIEAGLIINCVGGPGEFGVKETYLGNHFLDKYIRKVLEEKKISFRVYPFEPRGSDERQFSSPGFRIPCASIFKDKYGEYKYYHTSLDNLNFVKSENLLKSLEIYKSLIEKIEQRIYYVSLNQYGEAQLGKRGLYPKIGGINHFQNKQELESILWILFLGDGKNSLQDVADKIKLHLSEVIKTATKLERSGLIKILN